MKRKLLVLGAAVGMGLFVSSVRAESFNTDVSSLWAESYTDANGNYFSPASNTSFSGGALHAPIPTDGNSQLAQNGNEVVNFVRTRNDLPGASAAYDGSLLGDLSHKASLTATFNLTDTALVIGQQFSLADLVGMDTNIAAPSLRLFFMNTGSVNANGAGDMEPNTWWSHAGAVTVTSMHNGEDVTITAAFDPSQWSNYDGKLGSDPAVAGQFEAALSNVSNLGLSFGSGYFYSYGFAFDTGPESAASLNLKSINTVAAVPLPSAAWGGSLLLGGLALVGGLKRMRGQTA